MKKYLLPLIAVVTLSACTQLSEEDRALISSANTTAQEAKAASIQAAEDARKAREEAERAAAKADKIFRQGQNK